MQILLDGGITPLLNYSMRHPFTRQDAIKLGIDICRALELCQKFNIVHRDIKPENIFVSGLGDFKLGDFGIARTVEKTTSGLSKKGSYTYMAPEVYLGEGYGSGVDIYSLGIVMYRLLNDNRVPFLPEYPAPITYSDQEAARTKRFSGAIGETVQIAVAERVEEYEPLAELEKAESILAEPEQAAAVEHEPPSGDEETERILGEPDQNETEVEAESSPPATERSEEVSPSLSTEGRFGYGIPIFAIIIAIYVIVALVWFVNGS